MNKILRLTLMWIAPSVLIVFASGNKSNEALQLIALFWYLVSSVVYSNQLDRENKARLDRRLKDIELHDRFKKMETDMQNKEFKLRANRIGEALAANLRKRTKP